MKQGALILFSLVLSASIDAAGQRKNSETVLTDHTISQDKKATQIISDNERSLARQWMLTDTDWVKYKKIMQGPRGIWSPGLDPITALGVSETDLVERKRYATLWVKVETRRAELELAFEVERQLAGKKLQGDQLMINNTQWIKDWESNRVKIKKQVLLFADVGCTDECKDIFDEIYASVGKNARLDIFFVNDPSTTEIGQWASFMKIPPEVVRSRAVTLNFDEGESSRMNVITTKLPQVRVVNLETGETTATYK